MAKLVIQNSKPSIVWVNSELIEEKIGGQYYSTEYIQNENILRNNKLVKLEDVICEYNGGPMGFQLHSYDYVTEGIPVLRTKDMSELTVVFNNPIFITKEKHEELKNSMTYPGDIIISKTGQIGVVAVVPLNVKEANLNQALCIIRVKEGIIDNYFLAVFLNSKYGQYQFIRQGEGKAVQNGLTKDEILALQIPVISPEIQNYIGDKVRKAEELREEFEELKKEIKQDVEYLIEGNFDMSIMDKLSVNLKKPSFVYIEPNVIDDDRLDGTFYDNKYIENDIKIKKSGLRIELLKDVIEAMNSPIGWQGIPSDAYLPHGIGTPLIRVQNVNDLILDEETLIGVEDTIYEEQAAIQAQANDIIITRVGTIGRVCRIPEKISRIAMGQNLTRIKLKDSIIESGFALAYMSSKVCQLQMERYAYGGVQSSLTNKNIKQLLIPIPSPEIQKCIGDKVRKAEKLREELEKVKKETKQDVEDLIEGNFNMLKIRETN